MRIPVFILALSVCGMCCSCRKADTVQAPINEVPFTAVHFEDAFWAPRIETNRRVSIPSAFKQCEKNGRFDNFAIAGGLKQGEHQGDFSFDDTDPYKIIEGASYSLAVKYDTQLDAYLDSVIHLIAAAQEEDGYLCTCVTNKCYRLSGWWGRSRWEKLNSHELYNCGHLYEAAVAHYRATGKTTLLDVATKNADLICKVFGPNEGQKHVPSGHPIVEMGLAKLYKVTGKQAYLDLAKYFVEETGRGTDGHRLNAYSQDHKPILQQDEIVGHAVRAGYLYSGVADVAALTGDTAYFHALERIWQNMVGKKLYITGGIGSRAQGEGFGPNYELHNEQSYCETCAAIANVYWNQRMFLATGNADYINVLERALYNGVISGVSLSGDKFFYDNPLASMGEHSRQKWFGCACCPGNITRFMASIPNYTYATRDNDVFVNLYVQSIAEVETADNIIGIQQETLYPWDGHISISINPKEAQKFDIALRLPSWMTDAPVPSDLYRFEESTPYYTVRVNDHKVHPKLQHGYLNLNRTWRPGDRIEIDFPMPIRRIAAKEEVQDDLGKVALQRGPIVYCIEGCDMADGHVFNKYLPEDAALKTQFKADLLNGVEVLEGEIQQNLFQAIPYSTWNNRGEGEMTVWIPTTAAFAVNLPQATIASEAQASDWGLNDQWEPKSSADISRPYQYWWLKRGSQESVSYHFEKPEKLSKTAVYWLDFDHYDGNYRIPASWKLYYLDKGQWKEVQALSPYTTQKDQYNELSFQPVCTKGLKIVAQLREGESGGIIEWKVK